jgi:hypothetical protein
VYANREGNGNEGVVMDLDLEVEVFQNTSGICF